MLPSYLIALVINMKLFQLVAVASLQFPFGINKVSLPLCLEGVSGGFWRADRRVK